MLILTFSAFLLVGYFVIFHVVGSSKLEHTPLHSGGGRIVGGTDAERGRVSTEVKLVN